jgi:hypothetical protein
MMEAVNTSETSVNFWDYKVQHTRESASFSVSVTRQEWSMKFITEMQKIAEH